MKKFHFYTVNLSYGIINIVINAVYFTVTEISPQFREDRGTDGAEQIKASCYGVWMVKPGLSIDLFNTSARGGGAPRTPIAYRYGTWRFDSLTKTLIHNDSTVEITQSCCWP